MNWPRVIEADEASAGLVPPLLTRVYGEAFHDRALYDPQAISAAAAADRQHLFVAIDERGRARGLLALAFSLPSAAIAEVGVAVVDPALPADAGGRVLRALLTALTARARQLAGTRGLRCLLSSEVTTHRLTQRLVQLSGFTTTGILLGGEAAAVDRPRALPLDRLPCAPGAGDAAETISVKVFASRVAPYQVALPPRFEMILRRLYGDLKLPASFTEGRVAGGPTRLVRSPTSIRGVARIELVHVGADAPEVLKRELGARLPQAAGPILALLPLTRVALSPAVEALTAMGFCYGCLIPMFRNHDVLVLQHVGPRADRARAPNLHAPQAQRIFREVIAPALAALP